MTTPRTNASTDQNWEHTLLAVSSADGITPVTVEADPTNGAVLVEVVSGGTSSTTTAINDGANATIKATVSQLANSNPQAVEIVDSNGNQITSFGGGTQYANGAAVVTPTGSVALGYDGTDVRAMKTDSAGDSFTILTDGTNTANIAANNSTATGNAGNFVETGGTGFTTGTVTLNAGSPNSSWYDMLNYAGVSYEILTNTGGVTMTPQTTNDASFTNPQTMNFQSPNGAQFSGTSSSTLTAYATRAGRWIRFSSNASASNSITLSITFFTVGPSLTSILAGQSGTWTVGSNSGTGSAVPANAFYVGGINSSGNLIGLSSVDRPNDAATGSSVLAVGSYIYNGTTFDRQRSANGASNTTGTGLLGVGNLGNDGTNWQELGAVVGDTGYNGMPVNSSTKTLTFTTLASGAQTILGNTDMRGFSWVEVVYTSVGSGLALTGQFSTASGGTYVNQNTFSNNNGSPNGALGPTVGVIYTSPIRGNFFQIAVSALTSGTFAGTVTLRSLPPPSYTVLATSSQSGTWTVGSNSATGSATPANAFSVGGTDGTSLRAISVSSTGAQYVLQRADTSTLSNVASSATSVVILATNTARKGATVYNDSTQILYLKFGTTASTTSFTVPLAAAAFFEVPSGYTGEMDGIWASANGNARVTEIT